MFYLNRCILVVGIISLVVLLNHIATVELREVQSGESELWCHLHTGYQKIEPEMVIGLHSNGKWLFKNGSARSCEVIKLND